MSISKLISYLPDTVKQDIIDFTDVRMKTGKNGVRVMLDRLLTVDEKTEMFNNKHIVCVEGIAYKKYAPEIKYSYFYVV